MTKQTTASLKAEVREKGGKGVARALRREGKIPGVLYGKGNTPVSLALSLNQVTQTYQKGHFRSRVLELDTGKEKIKALPHELQFHPVTDVIEHVDFLKVTPGQDLRVWVPVKFVGAEKSLGIKRGGVLNVVRHEIEFFANPEKIPAFIEINVQEMDIGSSVHIEDIKLADGLKPAIKRNFTIATVAGRSSKMEEEAKPAEAAAAPAAGAAAPAAAAAKDEKKK